MQGLEKGLYYMKFKIDTTLKRTYDIDYIRFDCASKFGVVFTVKCREQLAYFEIEYDKLFQELEDNTYSSMKDIEKFNLSDMVKYLIERQDKYVLDKIVLALNDNECEVLRLEAYAD